MWQLDLIGHWNVAVLAFGLVCVAGCMQHSAWRGVMRSLDNFFKAASNNRWCEGSLATAAGRGREEGRGGWLIGSVYDPVRISCIVKFETQDTRAVRAVKTRTTYFVWALYLNALKAHSLHTDKPSPKLSKGVESKCTWQSGRGRREAVGVIKSDLATDPPSQLQTGGLRRQVEPTIGSLLLSEEWTCASVSACLFLDKTPRKLWRQAHVFFFFYLSWKKTLKHRMSYS